MNLVFERVVAARIEKDEAENKNPRDYFPLLMEVLEENINSCQSFREKEYNNMQKNFLRDVFGCKSLNKVAAELVKQNETAQQIFHFMLVSMYDPDYLPDLDDVKKIGKDKYIENSNWYPFWKYADMSVEEYTAVYLQAAKDVAAATLKPKEKKPKAELKKKLK
jgi:hypothetical protein